MDSTTCSTGKPPELSLKNLRKAMDKLKDIDVIDKIYMNHITWSKFPQKTCEIGSFPILGIDVDINDIIPDMLILTEYRSGKHTLINILTGEESKPLKGFMDIKT